jgi:hypothetical protein
MKQLFTFKHILVLTAMIAMFVALGLAPSACHAEDKLLDVKITQALTFKKDKNGQTFGRTFIKESRTLNGIEYQADTPLMFFGSTVEHAKKLRVGSTVKLIVSAKDYKGSTSYNVVAVLSGNSKS